MVLWVNGIDGANQRSRNQRGDAAVTIIFVQAASVDREPDLAIVVGDDEVAEAIGQPPGRYVAREVERFGGAQQRRHFARM